MKENINPIQNQTNQFNSIEAITLYYKNLNETISEVIDRYLSIFDCESFNKQDLDFFNKRTINYISLTDKEILIMNENIKNRDLKNIFNATMSETIKSIEEFFYSFQFPNDWIAQRDEYAQKLVTASGKHIDYALPHFNNFTDILLLIYEDNIKLNRPYERMFSFYHVSKNANEIVDLNERKLFFKKKSLECTNMFQKRLYSVDVGIVNTFKQRCKDAIAAIEQEQELNESIAEHQRTKLTKSLQAQMPQQSIETSHFDHNEMNVEQHSEIPVVDATLARQFLAIFYLLSAADKATFGRNKSEIARFVQFLTGKSYSNIRKHVHSPTTDPDEKLSSKNKNDIAFVKEFFVKLGLTNIAKQMERDLQRDM